MRRFILATTAIATLAVPALAPALASADVQRNQPQTGPATLTSTVTTSSGATYVHSYNIAIAPGGTFSGTGSVDGIPETITAGTITGSNVSFTATYDGSGYTWTDNGTTGMDSLGQNFTVTNDLTIPTYKNHGAYVSSQGGGADAAHSPIGMPINSNSSN